MGSGAMGELGESLLAEQAGGDETLNPTGSTPSQRGGVARRSLYDLDPARPPTSAAEESDGEDAGSGNEANCFNCPEEKGAPLRDDPRLYGTVGGTGSADYAWWGLYPRLHRIKLFVTDELEMSTWVKMAWKCVKHFCNREPFDVASPKNQPGCCEDGLFDHPAPYLCSGPALPVCVNSLEHDQMGAYGGTKHPKNLNTKYHKISNVQGKSSCIGVR